MTNGKGLSGPGLTPLQIEFCNLYVAGPNAGNGTRCIRDAGYKVESDEAAAAMASELLDRPDVRVYLALLYAERRAGRVIQSRPWERMLPAAQALQMEAIEVARDAIASMRYSGPGQQMPPTPEALLGPAGFAANPPNPDGVVEEEQAVSDTRPGLNPNLVTGPLVNLIKAGLEAAQRIEEYAIGKPITRTEQGAPGAFKEQGLRETVDEIRESMGLLEAGGVLGLLMPGSEPLLLQPATPPGKEVEVEVKKRKRKDKIQGNGAAPSEDGA